MFSALHPPHLRRPAGPHSQLAPREVLQPQVVRGARKQAAVQLAASEAAVRHVSSHGEWGVTATEQEGKGDTGGHGDAGNGGIQVLRENRRGEERREEKRREIQDKPA